MLNRHDFDFSLNKLTTEQNSSDNLLQQQQVRSINKQVNSITKYYSNLNLISQQTFDSGLQDTQHEQKQQDLKGLITNFVASQSLTKEVQTNMISEDKPIIANYYINGTKSQLPDYMKELDSQQQIQALLTELKNLSNLYYDQILQNREYQYKVQKNKQENDGYQHEIHQLQYQIKLLDAENDLDKTEMFQEQEKQQYLLQQSQIGQKEEQKQIESLQLQIQQLQSESYLDKLFKNKNLQIFTTIQQKDTQIEDLQQQLLQFDVKLMDQKTVLMKNFTDLKIDIQEKENNFILDKQNLQSQLCLLIEENEILKQQINEKETKAEEHQLYSIQQFEKLSVDRNQKILSLNEKLLELQNIINLQQNKEQSLSKIIEEKDKQLMQINQSYELQNNAQNDVINSLQKQVEGGKQLDFYVTQIEQISAQKAAIQLKYDDLLNEVETYYLDKKDSLIKLQKQVTIYEQMHIINEQKVEFLTKNNNQFKADNEKLSLANQQNQLSIDALNTQLTKFSTQLNAEQQMVRIQSSCLDEKDQILSKKNKIIQQQNDDLVMLKSRLE